MVICTGLRGSLRSIFKQVWLQIGACHTHKISNNSLSSSFVLILKIWSFCVYSKLICDKKRIEFFVWEKSILHTPFLWEKQSNMYWVIVQYHSNWYFFLQNNNFHYDGHKMWSRKHCLLISYSEFYEIQNSWTDQNSPLLLL